MSAKTVLVTGAVGEMGHQLLPALADAGYEIVALDLAVLPPDLIGYCKESVETSITETGRVRGLLDRHRPELVFHLAALLSASAERKPSLAHKVNVGGTVALLQLCQEQARATGRSIRFMFPSSIAVYGLPDQAAKEQAGAVLEHQWAQPTGMYGCNKLYGELLGTYYSNHSPHAGDAGIDFRAIRFPGLISADTVPTGGTSDYGPEMIHAAARSQAYSCFVREDSRLPFMTMPDAVDGFMRLAFADEAALSTRVYNIKAFSPTAGEFRDKVLDYFPQADIRFEPVPARQAIVDSWPGDVDDSRARQDWGFNPRHDFNGAMEEYVLPALKKRYPAGA
ncbi:MAG: NAD-dependent epimerase/dehydratase family protein [Acidobacteria bacterium]|uniref:NAD-dependent epimerase/dehydratase family protein n=1 Tax=Candidatus Polarisedimenticola svalbardensis TaxID=2886004 RepID=A0A8J6Y036_9BACT|nr:NAD-dependent epimerase/dehydratase family protein [Candidatus Polarisedimenticola svalbardensis]